MAIPKILAMVLAGGEGARLLPLTAERSKPAVPFGGRYRIVDFVLSNLVNSGIHSIYLLVQYKSQSLIEHVRRAWSVSHVIAGHFVTVVPPQMRDGPDWFQGTADAVHQNIGLIDHHRPDVVVVFGSDHVYRMDVIQMVQFHLDRQADVTVAALPVPIEQCCGTFGVIVPDQADRVVEFQEKPAQPRPMPGNPRYALASMGNYVFSTEVLIEVLRRSHACKQQDFGHDILPAMVPTHRVCVYNFSTNWVPGIKLFEEQPYWRDVGSLDAYYAAHMDMLGPEPRFDIFNPNWPIYSDNYLGPDAKVVDGDIRDSIIGGGTVIRGAQIRRSIVRREVVIEPEVEIDECIIMDYNVIGRGSKLRRTVVDRYNTILPDTRIGDGASPGYLRCVTSPSGIVIVPKGQRGFGTLY